MKGLLVKDLKLMKMQKKLCLVIIAMAIILTLINNQNVEFMMGYLSFVIPFFSLSTISYDEFDNGYPFLFTLPISRKLYVIEKYCFSLFLGLIALAIGVILSAFFLIGKGAPEALGDTLKAAPIVFAVVVLFLAIMLPLQLKLGAEKARIAIFLVFGGAFALGYLAVKALEMLEINAILLMAKLLRMPIGILIGGGLVLVICAILISIRISIGIMRKKEF